MPSFPKLNSALIDRRRDFNRSLFEWCLGRADDCLEDGNDGAAANWLLVAGRSAEAFGCGQLTSSRLEASALTIATRLDGLPAGKPTPAGRRLRWLHVLSIGYAVGGHTAMLRRWIEGDDSEDEHHLAFTFMDELTLAELRAAVERSGGKVTLLGGVRTLLDKARRLRDLAWREADLVVVHCHIWDVVPTIAFGVTGGPPVLLLNHADHTFWIGAAVADLVVNLRLSGEELTIRNRGVDRNFLFRIPLPDSSNPLLAEQDRAAIRARLGIPPSAVVFLTIGSAFKYRAVDDLDFPAMTQKLLAELPAAYLVAVGPSATDSDWSAALKTLQPRLILVGAQHTATGYHPAADIYLEGFPFDSHTALLEAAVSALPVVRIPACAVPPFSGHHFPLSVVTQPADVQAYLAQAIALANSPELRRATAETLHDAVVGLQCGAAWRHRLRELKQALPVQHAIHEPRPVDPSREFDCFWTAFLMRTHAGTVPPFVFELATELRLDGGELQPILAAYRRQLRRQSMEACVRIIRREIRQDPKLNRLLSLLSRRRR